MPKKYLSQARLKELLKYDTQTGEFTWLVSNNTRVKVGSVAGSITRRGYVNIKLDGTLHKAHRLAFLYMLGKMPPAVDHRDHNKTNNIWLNIRWASYASNNKNAPLRKDNTSGALGVSWYKRESKWLARIVVKGKRLHLGYFKDKADAIAARQAADIKHGYHKNHGQERVV